MSLPILATKLYIPPPRPKLVPRPRLVHLLDEGLHHKLTLISAPAGFGKTTLVSEWAAGCGRPVAWLSLDEGENDPTRFLIYLVAAVQTLALPREHRDDVGEGDEIVANVGERLLEMLQSPQPPPSEAVLTVLLNEITVSSEDFALVLDDYHAIHARPVDHIVAQLLERMPPRMHLVITTREDPDLPLARYRARGQLTELRVADLRFTSAEAAEFLNNRMGLGLPAEAVDALETRTEGWIAGLHLAALSMQGQQDTTGFIQSFTGSHHFVMDYLVEEVLKQQPEAIQTFLLRTSILDRLCGPLCDAMLLEPAGTGQETLEVLERANLFLLSLDNERHWYRYHALFADLLQQRLGQSFGSSPGEAKSHMNELHLRASQWFEDHGLSLEAFQHATAADDIERAERLMEGKAMPRHFRGVVTALLDWLRSLPKEVLRARPSLCWRYASLMLVNGQTAGVEEILQSAEAALPEPEAQGETRNLIGKIATTRATLALARYQIDTMLAQSLRALEYLHPDNLSGRVTANWTLGVAHFFKGDRAAARQAYTEAITLSQASDDMFATILATIGLANVQEADNELYQAAGTYQRILDLAGDQPLQIIGEAHLGLARILYEWNDLEAAGRHGQQSLELERQYDRVIDRFVICEVFLARLKLAQGDVAGAVALLAQADQSVRQNNFVQRMPEIAAAQVLVMLRQGDLSLAAHLAHKYPLPLSQARVYLAGADASAALAVLEPMRLEAETRGWQDERLKIMVLQAVAHQAQNEKDEAVQLLGETLALAEPGGFIRLFVDEGTPMAQLLSEASSLGIMPDYAGRLLAVFEAEDQKSSVSPVPSAAQPLMETLTSRELEVLQLIAQGLSNQEISERLFLAMDTVKGHNRKIFAKLGVQRRTEAVARARQLGLL